MHASAHSPPDGNDDRSLAKQVVRERDALRAKILELAAPPQAQTVGLDVLADCLIDRFAEALTDRTWTPLLSWVEATCDERPNLPNLHGLFTSMVPAVTQTFERGDFAKLEALLTAVVAKPRLVRGPATDTVDELDVLLAEMVGRVESVDPITAEHSRAVSAWCGRISTRMGLPRVESSFVARGGLIHDVGKSATPVDILQAPRALSESEWAIMRDHVLSGHAMVRDHPKLTDFAGIVRSHHERFDGAGYPDQLQRAEIPIGVRIVTVADAFNAMIGRRPYRSPFSPSRATAELQAHAGSQFDPNVVSALIDVVSLKGEATFAQGAAPW